MPRRDWLGCGQTVSKQLIFNRPHARQKYIYGEIVSSFGSG
jgi:hypothetical protein